MKILLNPTPSKMTSLKKTTPSPSPVPSIQTTPVSTPNATPSQSPQKHDSSNISKALIYPMQEKKAKQPHGLGEDVCCISVKQIQKLWAGRTLKKPQISQKQRGFSQWYDQVQMRGRYGARSRRPTLKAQRARHSPILTILMLRDFDSIVLGGCCFWLPVRVKSSQINVPFGHWRPVS